MWKKVRCQGGTPAYLYIWHCRYVTGNTNDEEQIASGCISLTIRLVIIIITHFSRIISCYWSFGKHRFAALYPVQIQKWGGKTSCVLGLHQVDSQSTQSAEFSFFDCFSDKDRVAADVHVRTSVSPFFSIKHRHIKVWLWVVTSPGVGKNTSKT